jgi:outer membrane protein OmpA-like peptidoglycan-associated protein
MKEETYFKNAWVFNGKLGLENNYLNPADIRSERTKELEAKSMDKPAVKSEPAIASATKPFYFRLISRYDGKEITATLLLKESGERSNYQTVKSGEIIFLREPAGELKSYNITAFVPGYKLSNIMFFYANPPIETGRNNEEIITLVADKGKNTDFVEFNHVQFYPSTSNLRPVSLHELDELGYLLKQHPKCKITIHGHSSLQDQESPDIASNPQKNTLLQSLSLARAETVKSYLVKLGIEPVRINTIGDELPRYAGDKSCYHNSETVDVEFVKDNSISTL